MPSFQKRPDVLKRRSTEENVRLHVLNAITRLESSRESISIVTIAHDLTTTLFLVLASQTTSGRNQTW